MTINKRDKLAVVKDKLRSMSLLQISPLPRETHSTSNKFNKPTRFNEIHDSIDQLPYNTKDHLLEGYTPREPESDL